VRCDTAAEVREAYAIAARESEALVLVEEFIEGTEHSSESLVVDGVVHTLGFSDRNYDTKYKYPPHLLENGDTCPTALPASVYSSVLAEVERAIRALGIEFGPAKGDILVRADGRVFMLEMAARLSGDYFCSHTAPLSNGTDIISAALQQAVGVSVDPAYLTWRYDRGVALRYFWPEPLPAVVTAIEGMDECRGLPGVEFITFEPLWADKGIGVGTLLTRPTRHAERVGCVMARGETREEALTLAEYVVDTVRITVDPQGSLSTEEAQ
jgi:biotin carboxylase